jgi:hypothetical protein
MTRTELCVRKKKKKETTTTKTHDNCNVENEICITNVIERTISHIVNIFIFDDDKSN